MSRLVKFLLGITLWLGALGAPGFATEADLYYQCSSTNTSGAVVVGWCPVSTTYAVPMTPGPYSYSHITTTATTLVKTGSGILHSICVNTGAASSTITIDDALTATTPTIAIASGATAGCFVYDVAFSTGLTVVTAVGTPDVTVSFK